MSLEGNPGGERLDCENPIFRVQFTRPEVSIATLRGEHAPSGKSPDASSRFGDSEVGTDPGTN